MKFSTSMYMAMNSIFQNLLKPNQTKFRIFAIENLKSLNNNAINTDCTRQ